MNNAQFFRWLVVFNGFLPVVVLTWDALHGQLGANSVNHAIHITGILSLVFLFLSLSMSPLFWGTRWGGWVAGRRALGLYGFFYAVAHLAIYIVFDRAGSLTSTLNELGKRRFLQVGAVAIILMIPLAVTSTNSMINRLGAIRWKRLHRLVYLVAILGVVHYYMLVKSDVRQPLAFGGVLAALLGTRLLPSSSSRKVASARTQTRELNRAVPASQPAVQQRAASGLIKKFRGPLRVAAIFTETPDVKTFRLVAPDGGSLPFEYLAGQFLNLHLTIAGKRVNRCYTLASSPTRRAYCELSIRRELAGFASRYMHDDVQVGDLIEASGPAGRFTFDQSSSDGVVLIAGGVGITPVMSILRALTDRAWPGMIHFVQVARTEEDLVFREELDYLSRRFPKLSILRVLSRVSADGHWKGECGRLTADMISSFVPQIAQLPVYLCGPTPMMEATQTLLAELGVPADQIHTEAFGSRLSVSEPEEQATSSVDVPLESTEGPYTTSAGSIEVTFVRSIKTAVIDAETTVLEAAEATGVAIPYECRSGFCGQCKTRLVSGAVMMECEDALSPAEKSRNVILACQSRANGPLAVDA